MFHYVTALALLFFLSAITIEVLLRDHNVLSLIHISLTHRVWYIDDCKLSHFVSDINLNEKQAWCRLSYINISTCRNWMQMVEGCLTWPQLCVSHKISLHLDNSLLTCFWSLQIWLVGWASIRLRYKDQSLSRPVERRKEGGPWLP